MFLSIPFVFAILGQQTAPQVFGQDLVVSFPQTTKLKLGPTFKAGTWSFEVLPHQSFGRRILQDGGWGDFESLYKSIPSGAGKKNYKIKVIALQYVSILETSPAGIVRLRRGTIDSDRLKGIAKELGTLKGMIEGTSHGELSVSFDAEIDDDWVTAKSGLASERVPGSLPKIGLNSDGASTSPLDSGFVKSEIGPRINSEAFASDGLPSSGPYDAIFVVHGCPLESSTGFLDQSTYSLVSTNLLATSKEGGLASALYDSWVTQFGLRAGGMGQNMSYQRNPSGEVANPIGGAIFDLVLKQVAQGVPAAWVKPSPGDVVASWETADVALEGLPKERLLGLTMTADGPAAVLKDAHIPTIMEVLSPGVDSRTPMAAGDFDVTGNADSMTINQKGSNGQGYVSVLKGNLSPKGGTDYLNVQVQLSSDENLSFGFYAQGKLLGYALLGGDAPTTQEGAQPVPIIDFSVLADNQSHSISIPLFSFNANDAIDEVRVESPFSARYERMTRGVSTLKLDHMTIGVRAYESTPSNSMITLRNLVLATGDLSSDQQSQIQSILSSGSTTAKLSVLSLLCRIKVPAVVPQLIDLSQSLYLHYSQLAIQALAFQDTLEAWAQIRQLVERGTFDHCRRFAAMEVAKRPDPAMSASLNFMATRSWHARLESARALGMIRSNTASIIMAAMLLSEPSPVVRLEIVKRADVSVELVSKRILYTAVNDSSQWVRAEAYVSLIDSKDKFIQDEALKGVRDDAVGVRLHILNVMQQRAQESYRPALRIAVIDKNSSVRAAALKAFATQPGPVDPNEVKNTFEDKNPEVREALENLAKIKGFRVPTT